MEYGTLTVTNIEIIALMNVQIIANSDEKVYDGNPLTNSGFTTQYLPDGYTVTAEVSGSQTNVGKKANTIVSYQIYDENGQPVSNPPGQNVNIKDGTLTVTPASVVVDCNYPDPLVENNWVDHYPFVRVNGSNAESDGVGYNRFKLYNGDIIEFTITGVPNRDATPGEYQLDHNATIISEKPGNYTVSFINDVVKIISEEDASAPQE